MLNREPMGMKRTCQPQRSWPLQVSVLNREPMGMKLATLAARCSILAGVSVLNREPMGMKRRTQQTQSL